MKEVKIGTVRGKTAKAIAEVLQNSGIMIYSPRYESGHTVLDVWTEIRE